MSKTVTLRLDDDVYNAFKIMAEQENRPLSNFIETATIRYMKEIEFVDEFEMKEINANITLKKSMEEGWNDYLNGRGEFI
jgi:predicted transcriptional regulator